MWFGSSRTAYRRGNTGFPVSRWARNHPGGEARNAAIRSGDGSANSGTNARGPNHLHTAHVSGWVPAPSHDIGFPHDPHVIHSRVT